MPAKPKVQELREAGFSDTEIANWADQRRRELSDAGFNQGEIDAYFGQPPFDPAPVLAEVTKNIQTAVQPVGTVTEAKPVTSFTDALDAGLQMSTAGLLARGKAPSKLIAEDAPRASRIAGNVAMLAGDFPTMVGGFLLGASGGPVIGTAGAFGLPAGMRRVLMDAYERGEVTTFGDWWDRASGAMIDTIKGMVTGAATAGAGAVAGKVLAPLVSPTVKSGAVFGTEVTTMVSVGKALEGEMPNADDFLDAAIVLGGVKGAAKTAAKLRKIYAETGVKPQDVVQDAAKDTTIAQDMTSSNVEIPKVYAPDQPREGVSLALDPMLKPRHELPREQSENLADRAEIAKEFVGQGEPRRRVFVEEPMGPGQTVTGYGSTYPDWYGPLKMRKKDVMTALDKIVRDKGEDVGVGVEKVKQAILEDRDLDKLVGEFPEAAETVKALKALPPSEPPVPPVSKPPAPPPAPEPGSFKAAQQAILDRVVQHDPKTKGVNWHGLYTAVVDNLHPIMQAVKEVGKPLPAAENPYVLERLTRGIYGKGSHFIKYGPFDFENFRTVGKSYEAILKPVQGDLDGFRAYMVAKRAIELSQRPEPIETGIPLEAANQVVKAGKAKYEEAFTERLNYRDALLDYLEKSGILSEERVEAMREANKAYVPFYRFFEEAEISRPTTAKRVRDPIKRIKGSEREILDPIESDIKDTFLFIGLAEKNAARQAFLALGPEFAEKVKRPVRPIELSKSEVKAIANEHGVSEADVETYTIFRPSTFLVRKDEIVVFTEGKREIYQVDPAVAEAFNASDKVSAGFLSNMLQAPARLLRAGVTISPDFIPRNVVRDAVSAFVYAGSNPIKTAKGVTSLLTKDTAFQNWMKAGGANATMVAMDRNYIQTHLFQLNARTGIIERALNVAKTPIEILRVTSELIENATRLGAIRKEIGQAKTKAAMQGLAMISREATVDFSRRGGDPEFQNYTRMVAFMNPGIQGIDRMFRAFKDNPTGTLAKSLAAITIPSLYLWWANHDDPRWNEIPRWQKDLFWIVFTEDQIYRIPKPFEVGIIFGSMPERALEEFVAENPDALTQLDETMLAAFGINVIPTFASPIVEQFAGRSLFTGQPLIPSYAENLMPEYQYTDYTTESAKALGQLLGAFPGLEKQAMSEPDTFLGGAARALTTPILIEHYLRAWSGGIGMYALQIADKALREAKVLPDPAMPTKTLADLPVIKAFVVRYPSASAQSIQDFYDAYTEKKRVFDTFMAKAKEGDEVAMRRVMSFDRSAMVQLDELKHTLTEQSQLVRLIGKNPEFTPDEQRQLIDSIYGRMIELARYGKETLRLVERAVVEPARGEPAVTPTPPRTRLPALTTQP